MFQPFHRSRRVAFALAVLAALAIVSGCDGQSSSQSSGSAATPTPDATPAPPPKPPSWAYADIGTKAYLADTVGSPFVCANVSDFTAEMSSNGSCPVAPVGKMVTIHKLRQDPGVFGGDAIYVEAKGWPGGLVLDSNLVAIVPKGTVIACIGDSESWTLRGSDYEALDGVDLRGMSFKAVVRHTLTPAETNGPAVHILSGPAEGHDGYLTFRDLEACKIDGTDFQPNFDWYDYEGERGPYAKPAAPEQ